jgi:LuxR family maltose regulon positive regulatory protein
LPIQRAGAVGRQRLTDRLDAAIRGPLTVVSAPAGFGKTTLISSLLAATTKGSPVAWLSLDQRDNDPALFWTYLVTAMRTAVPDLGEAALPLFAYPAASSDAALAALLNEIETLPHDLVLALDDYHLIESSEVHNGMAFILEHQPPQLHLVIVTRVDPPLPLALLRARGQLVEVRANELRFTSDEAANYLNGSMDLRLSDEDVAALEVLRLLGGDLSGPQIARHLYVSLNTVRTHTKSIYAKLGTTSRRAAGPPGP